MTALQRVLDRMPDDAHRQSFLRIVNEAGVKDDSPDMIFLALDHEARWAAVNAVAEERARLEAIAKDLPKGVEAALRASTEPLAKAIASTVGPTVIASLRGEIGEQLRAQHAIAMDSHRRAHQAIEHLEDGITAQVQRVGAAGARAGAAAGYWYPISTLAAIVIAAAAWFGSGPMHYHQGFEAGRYAQFHADATMYRKSAEQWRRYAMREH